MTDRRQFRLSFHGLSVDIRAEWCVTDGDIDLIAVEQWEGGRFVPVDASQSLKDEIIEAICEAREDRRDSLEYMAQRDHEAQLAGAF